MISQVRQQKQNGAVRSIGTTGRPAKFTPALRASTSTENAHQTRQLANTHDGRRYEDLLLAERCQWSAVQAEDGILVPPAGVAVGDSSDLAVAGFNAEIQAQLRQNHARVLAAIEQALVRIRQGRFGICRVCEEPIARARLEAVPWTDLCRNCKELDDRSRI